MASESSPEAREGGITPGRPHDARQAGSTTAIRVIIVEDRPADAELMVLGLQDVGFSPAWQRVTTGRDLAAALDAAPDLVLSDWHLPRFSGLEALGLVRARDPEVPFIIVSGFIGEEAAIDALHRGADDYVHKDRLARLGPAVRRALEARRLRAEQRQAAAQLAAQATILANVRDAILVADLAGRITYWNDGAAATYGYTADEIIGRHVRELSSTDFDAIATALQAIAAGEEAAGTWPMRCRDGREIWVDGRATALTDANGTIVGIIGVSRDVTEHRRAEIERERLAAAIEQAHDAVVITDTGPAILYVNPAFERVTGYTLAEAIGRDPSILRSGLHPPSFYQVMWSTLRAGRPWVGEFTNRRKDGSLYHEEARISPIRDSAGSIISYVAVKRDVTHERRLEEAARRAARERALIADTLAGLPTGGSAEETADAICRRVLGLSGLAAVALLRFAHDGRATSLAFLAADGSAQPPWILPEERSRRLRDRAREGPWIQRRPRRRSHPFGAILAEIGAEALAEVPVRHRNVPVGLLVAISSEAAAAEHLTATLPALVEFADLAGVILGPTIAEQTSSGRLQLKLRAVVERRAFRSVFQPVVHLETGQPVGFEALTRFDGGERPDLLIADAWSVGLGLDLELAALQTAVSSATCLPAGCWLGLNVSPRVLVEAPSLADVLGATDRPLVLEITEHEAVQDYESLRAAIRTLGRDVRVAVDDAGAGTANFAHIVGLHPDFVKLDVGLVRDVDRDVGRQALMVGMRHFATAAGCRLIAEGIETQAEADMLTSLGVELGQGYLYARPAPPERWASLPDAPLGGGAPG
jgi:PAS domain S-box-containing protein